MKKRKSKYTKEVLEKAVVDCISLSQLVRKLTGKDKAHGSMISYIKEKLIENKVDFSHFTGRSIKNNTFGARTKNQIINDYFKKDANKFTNNTNLKKWIFKFYLLEEKCDVCGLCNKWKGKYISLQLDHIDGDNRNNDLNNLRIICPNCHSQTKNYAGKKNRKIK